MSNWKSFGLATFAAFCLLAETAGSALAQCDFVGADCATEWSPGTITSLGSLPGTYDSGANSINDLGQVVGTTSDGRYAIEWSGGNVINLGQLPGGTFSTPLSINDAGTAVGRAYIGGIHLHAVEWTGGNVIDLGG